MTRTTSLVGDFIVCLVMASIVRFVFGVPWNFAGAGVFLAAWVIYVMPGIRQPRA